MALVGIVMVDIVAGYMAEADFDVAYMAVVDFAETLVVVDIACNVELAVLAVALVVVVEAIPVILQTPMMILPVTLTLLEFLALVFLFYHHHVTTHFVVPEAEPTILIAQRSLHNFYKIACCHLMVFHNFYMYFRSSL